jgi:predicted nucleic acid-binding protein
MIVVADTGPLNYLIRTGYPWILPEIFGRVLIPEAVLRELAHKQAPDELRAFTTSPPSWLECIPVRDVPEDLDPVLGAGEREAIALAVESHADVLLIDDLLGRRAAEERSIPARGTLAVLLQAGLRGYLDFPDVFEHILALGFRVSGPLRKEVLDQYHRERERHG